MGLVALDVVDGGLGFGREGACCLEGFEWSPVPITGGVLAPFVSDPGRVSPAGEALNGDWLGFDLLGGSLGADLIRVAVDRCLACECGDLRLVGEWCMD